MLFSRHLDESEKAQAKLKNLDESVPVPVKRKDVNTFQNNQVKFSGGGPSSIPPENMKCNILKAKMEEDHLKGFDLYHFILLTTSCIYITFVLLFRQLWVKI